MTSILRPYIGKFVEVWIDDILIFSKSREEHQEHVRLVLQLLLEHKLLVRKAKCEWFKDKVAYIGLKVSKDGVEADQAKVAVIREWPEPQNVQQMQQFLGLTVHLKGIVDGYAQICAPSIDLTSKKAKFPMSEAAKAAFKQVKVVILSTAIMALPDLQKPFVVRTDALIIAIGAVLQQEGRNVSFLSQKLQGAEKNYNTHDKEMLAIIYALKYWRHYLYGSEFQIFFDHRSLEHFHKQPLLNPRQRRWAKFLADYHCVIQCQPEKENKIVDALSRRGCATMVRMTESEIWQKVRAALPADEHFGVILKQLEEDIS